MNPSATSPWNRTPADEDLVEQARPGYGVPSQDPRPAAQFPLKRNESQREANSVLVGDVAIVGAAAGAANAQRAAREPDTPSVAERQDSGDAVREPVARPKRINPSARSSPALSP